MGYKTWITPRDGEFAIDIQWEPARPFVDPGGLYGRTYKSRRGAERWVAKYPKWLDLQPGDLPADLRRMTPAEIEFDVLEKMERFERDPTPRFHPSVVMTVFKMDPPGYEAQAVH